MYFFIMKTGNDVEIGPISALGYNFLLFSFGLTVEVLANELEIYEDGTI